MSPDPLDIEQTSIRDKKSVGYTLKAGAKFGEYRIVRPLGRGGMGEVYEVEHQTLHRRYALKLLPENFARQAGALERFEREAQVMANLDHPNILKVDDFRETGGRYWLRMELAGGQYSGVRSQNSEGEQKPAAVSLQDLAEAKGGRIPQEELVGILKQILEGLAYAHGRGVIHRDLKPSNILLFSGRDGAPRRPGSDGRAGPSDPPEETSRAAPSPHHVKIADFGLVRLVGEEWVRSQAQLSAHRSISFGDLKTARKGVDEGTSTQSMLGTYEYMSPEQKRGEDATERSDLYAVGLMTFRLLTGQALGMKKPSEINSAFSKAWDHLVLSALEDDSGARVASSNELLTMLNEVEKEIGGVGGEKSETNEDDYFHDLAEEYLDFGEEDGDEENKQWLESYVVPELTRWEHAAEANNPDANFIMGQVYYLGVGKEQSATKGFQYCQRAAELGHINGQYLMGCRLFSGVGSPINMELATAWYQKAAEQGLADAQNAIGNCFYQGTGVAQNRSRAVEWFRKAAEQGHTLGQFNLANCLYVGDGMPQNRTEAAEWYQESAEQGDADAQNMMGLCCYNGEGVVQDREQAVVWFREAAEQGHVVAQLNLANCLYAGLGIPQNRAEAAAWYRKAAEQGNAKAQNALGDCYFHGEGISQDQAQAVAWYRQAAEHGLALSQVKLGNCLSGGSGTAQDKAEAAYWYRKAAEQGHVAGQYGYGNCCFGGEGVIQNYKEAAAWYRKAAEQGLAEAQYALACCLMAGDGVVVNWDEAVLWLEKSADQGNANAQYILGNCYHNGAGVLKNWSRAMAWYRKAVEQGHVQAREQLQQLENPLSMPAAPALFLPPPDSTKPMWRKDGAGFHLWHKGQPLAIAKSRFQGSDLVVTPVMAKYEIVLRGYAAIHDQEWHEAIRARLWPVLFLVGVIVVSVIVNASSVVRLGMWPRSEQSTRPTKLPRSFTVSSMEISPQVASPSKTTSPVQTTAAINAGEVIDATGKDLVQPKLGFRYKVFVDNESDDRSAGIAKIGGRASFIPGARRGQTAIVDVTRVRERVCDAVLVEVLSEVELPSKTNAR